MIEQYKKSNNRTVYAYITFRSMEGAQRLKDQQISFQDE